MGRLTINEVLKPDAKLVVEKLNLDDPAHSDIKELFERTKERQVELMRIKNLPFENLTITI